MPDFSCILPIFCFPMQMNISSIGYLLAAAQALIMILVIARKPRIVPSEKYLMAALGFLGLTLVQYVLIMNRVRLGPPQLYLIGAALWQGVSPTLFLFCQQLVQGDQKWSWKSLRYYPFSLYMILQFLFVSMGIELSFAGWFEDWNLYSNLWIAAYLLNSLYFSWRAYRVFEQEHISHKQRSQLVWIQRFFLGFGCLLMILLGVLLYLMNTRVFIQSFEYLLLIAYALFVFILVFKSLRFSNYTQLAGDTQYAHAQKNADELQSLWEKLEACMQAHHPYLDPKLTLEQLARISQIPQNQLSQIFTRHLNANFYQYLNQYRFQAFEIAARQADAQQFTIMALAEGAGFASKATFYKLFKQRYGMTPAVYLKQLPRSE